MIAVLKYEADLEDEFTLPAGKVCAFAFQNGKPQVWIEVEVNKPFNYQTFQVWVTGYPFERGNQEHVATAVSDNCVLHLYRVPPLSCSISIG